MTRVNWKMSGRTPGRRGFTLLEVLISVVVLALGLLGVVAAFPAVIDLQRQAQDGVQGEGVADAASAVVREAIFDNSAYAATVFANSDQPQDLSLGELLRRNLFISNGGVANAGNASVDYQLIDYDWDWRVGFWPNNSEAMAGYRTRGDFPIGGIVGGRQRAINGTLTRVIVEQTPVIPLPATSRLIPQLDSGDDPQYVWDMVIRRVDTGRTAVRGSGDGLRRVRTEDVGDLPLEVAVFVRRIDLGIRVPDGFTLSDVLADDGTAARARYRGSSDVNRRRRLPEQYQGTLPVAATAPALFNTGVATDPTGTGRGRGANDNFWYSAPIGAAIQIDPQGNDQFDVVEMTLESGIPDAAWSILARGGRKGQIFVDNSGRVRTVVEVIDRASDSNTRAVVRVSPAFGSANEADQVVFTPQIPVAVRVLRFN